MKRFFIFLILVLLLFSIFIIPSKVQAIGFVIQGADATVTLNTTSSASLGNILGTIGAHFTYEFANANKIINLSQRPVDLQTLQNLVVPRFVMEFANANRFLALSNPAVELQTNLNNIPKRIVMEFANSNKVIALAYPSGLVGDQGLPQMSNISVTIGIPQNVKFSWTTDKLAKGRIDYGFQSNVYSSHQYDNYYVLQRNIILSNLVGGVTYYYQVVSIDRSGNEAISSEGSFKAPIVIFIPMVRR